MKVLNEQEAILSNFEVYNLVKEHETFRKEETARVKERQAHKKPKFKRQLFSRNWIAVENKVKKYLRASNRRQYEPARVEQFLQQLQPYNLTSMEQMQLLNIAPTTLVEVHLIVSDCSSRLSEDQTVEIVSLVEQFLPVMDAKQMELVATNDDEEEEKVKPLAPPASPTV